MSLFSTAVGSGLVSADADGWGHMGGWGWGMALFGWVFMVLVVALVVWAIWSSPGRSETPGRRRRGALDVLDERYARGEIERDEYLQRRDDLER